MVIKTFFSTPGLLLAFLFVNLPAAEKPKAGYLDRTYSEKDFQGKTIFIGTMLKSGSDYERIKDLLLSQDQDPMLVDTLLCRFSAILAEKLRPSLPKSRIESNQAACGEEYASATRITNLMGSEDDPDTLASLLPDSGYFYKKGIDPDIGLIVDKTRFGIRGYKGYRIIDYSSGVPGTAAFPGGPGFPGNGSGLQVHLPAPGFIASNGCDRERWEKEGDDPPEKKKRETYCDEDGDEYSKGKLLFSSTSFYFYDYRARKAFGYGEAILETKFHGKIVETLAGNKVDIRGHFSDIAQTIRSLFLQSKSGLVSQYGARELAMKKRPAPAESGIVKEVLDEEDEALDEGD